MRRWGPFRRAALSASASTSSSQSLVSLLPARVPRASLISVTTLAPISTTDAASASLRLRSSIYSTTSDKIEPVKLESAYHKR